MPAKDMVLLVSGGDYKEKTCVKIIDAGDGKELLNITGHKSDKFYPVYFESGFLAGRGGIHQGCR